MDKVRKPSISVRYHTCQNIFEGASSSSDRWIRGSQILSYHGPYNTTDLSKLPPPHLSLPLTEKCSSEYGNSTNLKSFTSLQPPYAKFLEVLILNLTAVLKLCIDKSFFGTWPSQSMLRPPRVQSPQFKKPWQTDYIIIIKLLRFYLQHRMGTKFAIPEISNIQDFTSQGCLAETR
jgi:hypothetical protein